MATPQYIRGDVCPIVVTVATAKAVDAGDLVGLSSNTLVRAEDQAWDTDLATTQTNFGTVFTGVCMQDKTSTTNARVFGNSTDNVITVATAGVWEFDIASATVEVGEFYGPAKDTGNALLSDKLVKVASEGLAVGVCVERGTSVTRVKVRLLSNLVPLSQKA